MWCVGQPIIHGVPSVRVSVCPPLKQQSSKTYCDEDAIVTPETWGLWESDFFTREMEVCAGLCGLFGASNVCP